MKILSLALLSALASPPVTAQGLVKNIRATELASTNAMTELEKGEISELDVEFRQGDQLPMNLRAEGDLIESVGATTGTLKVKKDFWLRLNSSGVDMSLDGIHYRPFKDLLGGSFTASAGADETSGVVNAVDLVFRAVLR